MCDVLFITPNVNGGFVGESIGTLQLATILKNNGLQCKVLSFGNMGDIFQFDDFMEKAISKICKINPRIVSFYTRCDTFHISLKIAEQIKLRNNNIPVIFGGPQSDTTSVDVIAHVPYVDFVCCGEGETTIYPFFHSILEGKPDLTIPGLVYRLDGEVKSNPRPELIADLDTLPLIDYSIYFNDFPEDIHSIYFQIDVGRGCPFGCSYCSTQAFWGRKYRLKSPQRIVEEVKLAHKNFGVTAFRFDHDMFTFNRKKVMETCKLIKELDFSIKWICSARLDCIDKELIDCMVDAGMINLFVGIETGSKRMQKLTHKNLNLDKIMALLFYLRDKHIDVDTSFIYGFPEETKEDLSQTVALMKKIMYNRCGTINTHLCTFLPKTELSERYWSELTPTEKYTNFTGDFALSACEDVIIKYPMLFPQLMEYHTELRTSLKYFAVFIRVWMNLVPIYHFISEKYSDNSLIDMYYDFVKTNKDALEKYGDLLPPTAAKHVIREDKMHLCLEGEVFYDFVTDYRRMIITRDSDEVNNGVTVTDVFCFDPENAQKVIPIEKYEYHITAIDFEKNKMHIRKLM